ncbi:MAG: hypothetical protein LBD32_00625 [Cytophagales bacterium]|nr:hypothetical protein [Cytophagales bacterium]
MANKIVFSLLLTIFTLMWTNVEARGRKRSDTKKKSGKVAEQKQPEVEVAELKQPEVERGEESPVVEKRSQVVVGNEKNVYEDTQRIVEHNDGNQPQRFVNDRDSAEGDEKSEEERRNEISEAQRMENERVRKERQAAKELSRGVSGNELVGEEFRKWSAAKAKTTSKEFKRMYLENIKMKRILRRLLNKQKGVSDKTQQTKVAVEEKQEVKNHSEEIFYIYGNYEDEEGELSGDAYIKWSTLKAKVTAKQFRSLVKRNNFLQLRTRKLMNEKLKLTKEVAELQLRNRRLLVG